MGCGALLPMHHHECPTCGFDNDFERYQDIDFDDRIIEDLPDDYAPDPDESELDESELGESELEESESDNPEEEL